MELWNSWFSLVNQFKAACGRKRTFFLARRYFNRF
jgi:hypothetical protein